MRPMITVSHAPLMRSPFFPKPVLAAALGCLILASCGAQKAADQTPTGSAMSANLAADDAELGFMELSTRLAQGCSPDTPDSATPEDLPGDSQGYPTSSAPPGTPDADGDIPVPVESPAELTLPAQVNEVALNGLDACVGGEHIKLISSAFKGTGPASYQQMADKLTALGYPATRIYNMPEPSGSPRARLDLRIMGSRLALEVTATGSGVVAEAFGVPEQEDVSVAQVQRK